MAEQRKINFNRMKLCLYLGCVVTLCLSSARGQTTIDLKGQHVCSPYTNNQLRMTLAAYDANNIAVRLTAIDSNAVDITSCMVAGQGTQTSPFIIKSLVDLATKSETSNSCGMTVTQRGGVSVYTWKFKAYANPINTPQDLKGYILNVECPENDLTSGHVETRVEVEFERFVIQAVDPLQITGVNSVALNTALVYNVNILPTNTNANPGLADAVGIYVYNCYSSTNANMVVDRELFIDANGCPVSGADFAPSSGFYEQSNDNGMIILEARNAVAKTVNNKNTIHFSCLIGKCTQANDPYCSDRCAASRSFQTSPSGVDTGVMINSNILVQDLVAQELKVLNGQGDEVQSVESGDSIYIQANNVPAGIGATSNINDAVGFYIYNCRYSTSASMNNAVQFINNEGCPASNDLLTASSAFTYDSSLSIPQSNLYVLKTGSIVTQVVKNRRIWIRCDTGKCIEANHNFCRNRCGASDNIPGAAVDLGFLGQETSLSILDVNNERGIDVIPTDSDGDIVNENNAITIGDPISLNIVVTPGAQGVGATAFTTAKGIYLYSCSVTSVENQSEREYFVDADGCPVENSPFKTSQQCQDQTAVKGVPPFLVDCGEVTIPDAGTYTQTCSVGICTTEDHPACQNRCLAGPFDKLTDVEQPAGLSSTSPQIQVNYPKPAGSRTAVKSEQLRNTIVAVSVVGAVLLLAVVSIGTCLIVKSQRSRAKRDEDSRDYNY